MYLIFEELYALIIKIMNKDIADYNVVDLISIRRIWLTLDAPIIFIFVSATDE